MVARAVAVCEPVVELGVEGEKEALANHPDNVLEVVELDNLTRGRVEVDRHRVEAFAVDADDFAPVVGDSYEKDIIPAHTIGCKTVWIKGESWQNNEPEQGVADRIITSLKELNT